MPSRLIALKGMLCLPLRSMRCWHPSAFPSFWSTDLVLTCLFSRDKTSGQQQSRTLPFCLQPGSWFLSTILVNGSPAFPTNINTDLQLAALGSKVEMSPASELALKGHLYMWVCVSLDFSLDSWFILIHFLQSSFHTCFVLWESLGPE